MIRRILARRWLRVSVRLMLILVAVGSVPLAMMVNRAHRQGEAVRAIRRAGGSVVYDWQVPPPGPTLSFRVPPVPDPPAPTGPAWLRRLVGDDLFQSVDSVSFSGQTLDDGEVAGRLRSLPGLKSIQLYACTIGPGWFAKLPPLDDLERLTLFGSRIDGAGLAQLARLPRLKFLEVEGSGFGDEAVPHLLALPGLEALDLSGTAITESGVARLAQAPWPHLTQLTILGGRMDDAALTGFRARHPNVNVITTYEEYAGPIP